MNQLRTAAVLFLLLAAAGVAQGQDFKQRFVGKSPCAPDIQSESSDFSLRLDEEQDLTLLYRDLSAVKVVMIIEPTSSGDHCGVIRDVVQITHLAKDFAITFSRQQLEVHSDGVIDFNRLAVQQRRLIPPLANRFDCRSGKVRIDLAVQNLQL